MPEALVVVLDVNALIDCCVAVHGGVSARPAWWRIDDQPARSVRGAALLAALEASLSPEVSIVLDEKLLDITHLKLCQSPTAKHPASRGLGLSGNDAISALDTVVDRLGHRTLLIEPPAGVGYLEGHEDYEDRRVWGLFERAMAEFPDRRGWLILTDRNFQRRATAAAPNRHSDGKPVYLARPPVNFIRAMFHYRRV